MASCHVTGRSSCAEASPFRQTVEKQRGPGSRQTMRNSSRVTFFVLSAYQDLGPLRYPLFLLVLLLYVSIVCSNLLLILSVCLSRSLRQPMYLFLCSLALNQLFGSLGLFPFLLVQLLSRAHTVPAPLCLLQIFCLYSYASVEFLNLSVMSYDRYLAVCRPLQYRQRMSGAHVAGLLLLAWLAGAGACLLMISLSASLRLCGNVIPKVYCDNYLVVKLACGDTRLNNVSGVLNTTAIILGPLGLTLFSYAKILQVCFSGSQRAQRRKALGTCVPHLASLLNFSCGAFFEVLQSRFDMSRVPVPVRVLLSLYWLAGQPLFNPLVYGLKLSGVRTAARALLVLRL
ncbi:olfactory receptor 11A1-like [Synchiropus picturatus]